MTKKTKPKTLVIKSGDFSENEKKLSDATVEIARICAEKIIEMPTFTEDKKGITLNHAHILANLYVKLFQMFTLKAYEERNRGKIIDLTVADKKHFEMFNEATREIVDHGLELIMKEFKRLKDQ